MRRDDIRQIVREHGEAAFLSIFREGLQEKSIKADDLSLRSLYEALVGPVETHLEGFGARTMGYVYREDVGTSAYTHAVGSLLASKVIEGYSFDEAAFIGDELVFIHKTTRRNETYVGFGELDGLQEVQEAGEYQESSPPAEKYVTSVATKRGRLLALTEELIREDQTGEIYRRAQDMGKIARLNREKRILRGVTGADTNVYRKAGNATTLYSSDHANLKTSNPLVDWTDVDGALQQLAAQTDDKSNKILTMPKILLVPFALEATADRVVSATETRDNNNPATGTRDFQTVSINPKRIRGLKVLSNTLVSDASGDSTSWWVGDFKRVFGYHEVFPIQVMQAPRGHEADFRRDIVALFKVREQGNVFATDHRHIVKNTA